MCGFNFNGNEIKIKHAKKTSQKLITSYINFVDIYEANISEAKLERIKKVMYDFSNFVDEFVNEFSNDDEDKHSYDFCSVSSYYIMNNETGEFDEYDSDMFADEDDEKRIRLTGMVTK